MSARSAERSILLEVPEAQVLSTARKLKEHYLAETGDEYPERVIVDVIRTWVHNRFDSLAEDLADVLTTPSRTEAQDFRRLLEDSMRSVKVNEAGTDESATVADVFTGCRPYSFEKLAAMTVYIAGHGENVYKTKLNKLLFYSDFVNYHLHGTSISGSRYVHLPYGPVPDKYESMLRNLASAGMVRLEREQGCETVEAGEEPITAALGSRERATIDWVLETYGPMTAAEISDLSHREKAYRFTRAGEPIAYEYAKFLRRLPELPSGPR